MDFGRLFLVTGKGGTGKSTVASALALRSAQCGSRTLLVDLAGDGQVARMFGVDAESAEPLPVTDGLDVFSVDNRRLVEDYFTSVLRFSFLSQRLFESSSFNALTAAAPGITEFLLLERVVEWLGPGSYRRRGYDAVIIDGPATGHAVKLLRAPRNLLAMVPGGPLARSARKQLDLLEDWQRTRVLLVALPEELVVRETIETFRALRSDAIHVGAPIVNRVFPRRFSPADTKQLEALPDSASPVMAAARFAIAARRDAERHVAQLRRALGIGPVLLPLSFETAISGSALSQSLARRLDRVLVAA